MRWFYRADAVVVRISFFVVVISSVPLNGVDVAAAEETRPKPSPSFNREVLNDGGRLAVAWNNSSDGAGVLRLLGVAPPWDFQTPTLPLGPDSILRYAGGRLYAVSRASGVITVVSPDAWTTLHAHSLGANAEPQDIAVISPSRAYVTRREATRLLRLDPITGETQETVDLGVFAETGSVLDIRMMAVHEGRLFVQFCLIDWARSEAPGFLAVVDLSTEQLIDADPTTPGVQAIALQGAAPRFKMQIVPESRLLFVSATGVFFDNGGIEMVDLDALQSTGMAIRESDGQVGADLGAFVLTTPERGYLTFSTDLMLSSHLFPFSVTGGVTPGPQLHEALGYFVPTLVHEPVSDIFFFPEGGFNGDGVHVFDSLTGVQLTWQIIATTGPPTDMVLLTDFDCDGDGDSDIDDFLAFETCMGGPDSVLGLGCLCSDRDSNASVDMNDFAAFQIQFSGGAVGD